ncbi:hypothetical protein [uncultured Bradyrhizobium sp.]|uniref:hypothetical protein n=1 Tax=uncultured Bradyrhizobium sp. TaxID=199684 RepID=UPI00260D8B21|nr:hypothetical protein [uncultured Bradyrhizobium sp.]
MIASPTSSAMVAAAMLLALTCTAEAAPPKQLYGKSVTLSWNETRSQRDGQSGPFKPVTIPYIVVIYISTEGHLFTRSTAKGGSGAGFGSADATGTTGRNGFVEARSAAFNGTRIVANSAFGGAGRHTEISFSPDFSSCTASVVTGMPRGAKTAVVRSIATGGNVEFESVSAGLASCSISSGNPF